MTARLREVDPLGPVIALAGFVIFVVQGFDGILTRDLALYGYSGQQAVEGVPPFESVLNRAGPLAHLVPAVGVAGARAIGIDDLLGMRVLMLLLSVLIVWLLYVLGRDAFGSRLAGIASASALLTFEGFVTYATGGPREKTTMALLVVLALWCVLRRHWFVAGVVVALATLTWQPAFVTATAAVLAGLAGLRGSETVRAAGFFAGGGILTTGLFALGFWLAGALDALIECFLLINLGYTEQAGVLEDVGAAVSFTIDGFGWSLAVIVTGLVGAIAVAAARAPAAYRSRDPRRIAVIAIGAASLGGLLWSLRAYNGWADLVVVLPPAALGIGALAGELRARIPARTGTLVVAGFSAFGLVVGLVSSLTNYEEALEHQRAEVDAMFAAAPSDATIVSIGAPQPLLLTKRRNPFRHQMFLTGLDEYVDDTYPGGLEGFVRVLRRRQPTLIVVDHPNWYSWLRPTIAGEYVPVGTTIGSFTWYAHHSLRPEVIADLQAADTDP
ncbi:MAG: hypothetical protein ACRDOM_10740 [Nocardioides sp.]